MRIYFCRDLIFFRECGKIQTSNFKERFFRRENFIGVYGKKRNGKNLCGAVASAFAGQGRYGCFFG